MSDINEHQLIYFESEEHLVRRLGAALVSYWSDIPKEIEDKLLDRAILVLAEDHSDHLNEQMRRFVASHTKQL